MQCRCLICYLLYAILLYILFPLFAVLKYNVVILNMGYVGYNELSIMLLQCFRGQSHLRLFQRLEAVRS